MLFTKTKKNIRYTDLSSKEKKKVIKKSIHEANKEQSDIIKAYKKLKHAI